MILPVLFLAQVLAIWLCHNQQQVFFSVHSISLLLLMSRQFMYQDAEGNPWSLTIRGRQLCVITSHGTSYEADPSYLQRAWYQTSDGNWLVLENQEIHWKTALVYLATVVLPWWEDEIHHEFLRVQRKEWSRQGQYVLGETDRLYDVLISLALHVRANQGLPRLWTIGGMAAEARGDVIEGILGLAYISSDFLGDCHRRSNVTRWVLASILGLAHCWNLDDYRNVWDPIHLARDLVDSTRLDNFRVAVAPPSHEVAQHAHYVAKVTPKVNKRNALALVVSAVLSILGGERKRNLIIMIMEFVGDDA